MPRVAVYAVAAVIAVVLQTTLPSHVPFLPAGPDLMLVLTIYLGLHVHSAGGAVGAFLFGYLVDTFAGVAPGLSCLTMTLVFGVVYMLSKRLWMENPVSNVAAVALGEGIKIATVLLFLALLSPGDVAWLAVLRTLGFEAVFALLCTPLVFSALDAQLRGSAQARAHAAE